MMGLYFLSISGFRFPGRGLHDIVGEEVMIIALFCYLYLSHVCGLSGI